MAIRQTASAILACTIVGGSTLAAGAERDTIPVPLELSQYLSIPLFTENHQPTSELTLLLDLTPAETTDIAQAINDVRTGLLDHLVTVIEVHEITDDKMHITIPALGEVGNSYETSLKNWIGNILGEPRAIWFNAVLTDRWGDNQLTEDAFFDFFDDGFDMQYEITFERTAPNNNRWKKEFENRTPNGRSRGSSSSSGSRLDGEDLLLYNLVMEHFGDREPAPPPADHNADDF